MSKQEQISFKSKCSKVVVSSTALMMDEKRRSAVSTKLGCELLWLSCSVLVLLSTLPLITEARCPKFSSSSQKTPYNESSWCLQIDGFDSILLDGSKFRNLSSFFRNIGFLFENEKEIKELDQLFLINNHALELLDRNAFCDFRFRRIVIRNCTHLRNVHPEAFNGTADFVKALSIDGIAPQEKYEDFFEALNSLTKLEELELRNYHKFKIRPYSFRQPLLSKLVLGGQIELIENNSFLYLDNIRILKIIKSVRHMQQHAFHFKLASNKTLDIYLEAKLGIIDRGIFIQTNRPLNINLYLSKLIDLDPVIWGPVLMAPIKHELIFHGILKEMKFPCKLLWLFQHKFNGVVTFKDEPLINEAYFDKHRCPEEVFHLDDQMPEMDHVNRAGIDSHNHALSQIATLPILFWLTVMVVKTAIG